MKYSNKIFFTALIFTMLCSTAHAREAGGQLKFIANPNSARPYFAEAGGEIYVDVYRKVHDSCSCAFFLYLVVDDQQVALQQTKRIKTDKPDYEVMGKTDPGMDVYRFSAVVPKTVPPGLYTLEAKKGGNQDFNDRSVRVYEKFPESLKIMHINDVYYPGADDDSSSSALANALFENVHTFNPDIVVITGAIPGESNKSNIMDFIKSLDTFNRPVIVVPNAGIDVTNKYFGSGNFLIPFGAGTFISMYSSEENPVIFPDESGRTKWLKDQLIRQPDSGIKIVIADITGENAKEISSGITHPESVVYLFQNDPENVFFNDADSAQTRSFIHEITISESVIESSSYKLIPQAYAPEGDGVTDDTGKE